jgi:hypothetical protein
MLDVRTVAVPLGSANYSSGMTTYVSGPISYQCFDPDDWRFVSR